MNRLVQKAILNQYEIMGECDICGKKGQPGTPERIIKLPVLSKFGAFTSVTMSLCEDCLNNKKNIKKRHDEKRHEMIVIYDF
jgi:hypothetical protein